MTPSFHPVNQVIARGQGKESDSPPATIVDRVASRLMTLHPPTWAAIALALLLTLVATYGDAVTSAATTFTLFYILALAIGTWFVAPWMGYVVAALAVLGETIASLFTSQQTFSVWFLAWNDVVDLLLYVGTVQVLWALRLRLEREVLAREDALGQLRHAERLTTIGKLASGLAHEIGTPLNVISGRAELIVSGTLSAESAKHSAQIVIEQTERVAVIIRQLLDFSRRGGTKVTRTDLTDLVDTTALLLAPIAAKARVIIACSGAHVEANLNRPEIQQVITNLLTNAIHAMPDGGSVEVQTSVEITRPPGRRGSTAQPYAVVRVRDHGTGIAPEVLPKVFDPFFTTKDLGRGTGLGLSVAYGIIRDHKGWLTIDTKLSEGTTVTLHVPQ